MTNKIIDSLIEEAFKEGQLQEFYQQQSELEETGEAWFKFPKHDRT